MDGYQNQKLVDLGSIVNGTRKRLREFTNEDIQLSDSFKRAFSNTLSASGNSVTFDDTTVTITTSAGLKIYAPNQWFVLATYAVELVEEIIKYRTITEGMLDKYQLTFGNKDRKEIYKSLKLKDNTDVTDQFKQYLTAYLNEICSDEEVLQHNFELLCRFVSDSEWWLGGKGIERTNDFYVSPVLRVLNLVNASQSYVATITYLYIMDKNLQKELKTIKSTGPRNIVGEEELMEKARKLKTCLEIEREPRTSKIHPLNCIFYGAPGTGKTYSTAEYALAIVEGRAVDRSKKSPLERKQVMKTYNEYIKKGQVVFTTFHQSYGYEEFIQGLRPDTKSDNMSFMIVDGVFKKVSDLALNDADNNYVIIIDEINRGNISKVFGELITLIEDDKRWGELNETCVTLQSGAPFAVPNNLYIIGTMNSADKSISLIDAALRRRFAFIEQKPEADLVEDNTLKKVLVSLNALLADELDSSDLLIGHSYFLNKTVDDLPAILNNSIIPLLYEYFYDNKRKVASVLKDSVEGTGIEIVDDKIGRLSVKKVESQV